MRNDEKTKQKKEMITMMWQKMDAGCVNVILIAKKGRKAWPKKNKRIESENVKNQERKIKDKDKNKEKTVQNTWESPIQ